MNKLTKLIKKRESVLKKYSVVKDELDSLDNQIKYINEFIKIKPQLLFNQGRDKKYIYGQVYWYSDDYGSKKKSYRYLIGKMSEKKSRKEGDKTQYPPLTKMPQLKHCM